MAESKALVPMDKLNELAKKAQDTLAATTGKIAETFTLATVIQELRSAVLPLVPKMRPLIGTTLGFRTDRDTNEKGSYSDSVVADVLVEAVARGLRWTGNEFNIISGRLYTTKEGYARLVKDLEGMTDLELSPSVPRMSEGGAVVKYKASWSFQGKPFLIERDIPVKLNTGMGADAALGKATRKMLASIHARVTGSVASFADGDAEDVMDEGNRSKAAGLADRFKLPVPAELPERIAPTDDGIGAPGLFPTETDVRAIAK